MKAKLHDVTFSGRATRLLVHVDGKRYTRPELADMIGMSASTIYRGLLDKTEQERRLFIQEMLWIMENNAGQRCRIYKRDGVWVTGKMVSEITGVTLPSGHKRCSKWEGGRISTDQLMKHVKERFFSPNSKGKNTSEPPANMLDGLQPRRHIESLGPAGTWESRNLPHPKDGMGTGSRPRCSGVFSKGMFLGGD